MKGQKRIAKKLTCLLLLKLKIYSLKKEEPHVPNEKLMFQPPRVNPQVALSEQRVQNAAFQILENVSVSNELSIGLELEFFLRDENTGELCSLAQSQQFLTALSQLPNWKIFTTNSEHSTILKVSKNIDSRRYHSVKYEHPPHMMELALAYETDLISLKKSLIHTLSELNSSAQKAFASIDVSLKAEPVPVQWDIIEKVESRFKPLSDSRKKIFFDHTNTIPDHRIDFTTYTAATQFHIGGIQWWSLNPKFIDNLYHAEFIISALAYKGSKDSFDARWTPYRYVFGSMPLLGFPSMKEWTNCEWIKSLLKSPYNGNGFKLFEDVLPTLPAESLTSELLNLRDLQIIKPKWIGTLEYRSDPAISNTDLILKLAALRFGVYIHYTTQTENELFTNRSLLELSKEWWAGEHITVDAREFKVLEGICHKVLLARGLGEEKLL